MRINLHLSVAVLMWVVAARSQEATNKGSSASVSTLKAQTSQSQVGKLSSPQPSPEIERLAKAFVGKWSIDIKIDPNESMPKGGKGEGEEIWRPGPGGLSLIEDYHSTSGEGEITGLGIAWWDKHQQRYQVMWCDNINPAGCVMMKEGARWEASQVVAVHEWENAGKHTIFKEVFSEITENSFTQTLYQGESGSELKRTMTILATKKTEPVKHSDVVTANSVISQAQRLKMPGPEVQNSMLGTWSITGDFRALPRVN